MIARALAPKSTDFKQALQVIAKVGFWNLAAPIDVYDLEGMARDLYQEIKEDAPGFQREVCEKFSSLLLTLEYCTKWHHDRIFRDYLPFLDADSQSRIAIYDDDELDELDDAEFIIDKLIIDDTVNVIYGPSNDGKTVAAVGMGISLCTGEPWMGHRVRRTGPVFYVNSEAFNETKDRKNAWKCEYDIIGKIQFYGVDAALDLAGPNSQDVDHLIEQIEVKREQKEITHLRPAAIFIDTLAMNFGGEDENSTAAMNLFVMRCDRIRKHFACPVFVVHHTGHNKTRERGARSLRNACYTMIEVKRVKEHEPVVAFSCVKMRGAPFFEPITMRLTAMPHIGAKGSIVFRQGNARDIKIMEQAISSDLTPGERAALAKLHAFGATGASSGEWKKATGNKSTFYDWRRYLESKALIAKHNSGNYYLTEKGLEVLGVVSTTMVGAP